MILETSVGRIRWCVGSGVCHEATMLRAGARKEARERGRCRFSGFTNPACPLRVQRQMREQAYQRARSVLTQQMKIIEGRKFSVHAAFVSVASGQLRFLG